MKPPGLLGDIIARSGQGWDFFQGLDQNIKDRIELAVAKTDEDQRTIAEAWAGFAATPAGEKALQALFDSTLNRTVYFANLGQDINSMAIWGAFREGQNALAHAIARQIALGRDPEDKPKPRDLT